MENNENVTNEVVEEKKVTKKSNTPMIVIGLAILLIAVGVVLILTGNNKSFLAKDKEENIPQDEEKKNITPVELRLDTAIELIENEKTNAGEEWVLGNVEIVARGDDNNFLVKYDKEYDTNTETVQTIIRYDGENWVARYPGWPEGSEDLTSFNFVYNNEEPVEEPTPTEEPVPTEEPTPTEEPAPTEEPTPVEEPTLVEDNSSVEEQPIGNNEATE